MKLKTALFACLLPFLSGSLFSVGLAPLKFWPATFASIALWYFLLEKFPQYTKRISFFYGYGFFITGVSWIYFAFITVYIPPVVAALSIFVFCCGFSLLFLAQGWVYIRFFQSKALPLLSFALIWMLFEWTRTWLFTGFPWLFAGYSLTDTYAGQMASVTSVYGISFFVALFAVLFCKIHTFSHTKKASVLAGFIGIFVFGFICQNLNFSQKTGELKVAAVQSNVDQKEKWSREVTKQSRDFFLDQTHKLADTDLIVWPEAALTDGYNRNAQVANYLDLWGKDTNTGIILGTPRIFKDKPRNALVAAGNAVGAYDKVHLVPFGEYMPYGDLIRRTLPFLSLNDFDYYNGSKDQPSIILNQFKNDEYITHKISSIICYEAAYPSLVRESSIDKAIIVTASNDDWFGDSLAPHQHLQIAQMRAIENRLSVVRSTQSGITAFIDPYGKISAKLEPFTADSLVDVVSLNKSKTFYQIFGHLYLMIISILVLAGVYFRVEKLV